VRTLTPNSVAFAWSRAANVRMVGSYSGRGDVPGAAPAGNPVSTSTTCRSHVRAAASTTSGRLSSSPNGSTSGTAAPSTIMKSGAAIR